MSRLKRLIRNKITRARSATDLAEWTRDDEKLMKAVEKYDFKKVDTILVKKQLNPIKLGPRGLSVFHVACAIGNERIVDLLLSEISDVNDLTIQGNTALQLAAAKGHIYTVEKLIQHSAEVDIKDSNEMTALHRACAASYKDCANALLQAGADPHMREQGGKTPLFYSAHRGDVDVCSLLLSKGANIDCQDLCNLTPLMIAAKLGHLDVCNFLLQRGANSDLTDKEGHTALAYAKAFNNTDLVQVFTTGPRRAFENNENGTSASEVETTEVIQTDLSTPTIHDPVIPISPVEEYTAESEDECDSQHDRLSTHSLDDRLISRSEHQRASQANLDLTRVNREQREEIEQLTEDFSSLSVENLKLRDRVESLTKKIDERQHQDGQSENQHEIESLKFQLLEKEKKIEQLENEQTLLKQVVADQDNPILEGAADLDNWPDSEDDDKQHDKQKLGAMLISLRNENEKLKYKLAEKCSDDDSESITFVKTIVKENETNEEKEEVSDKSEKELEKENTELKTKLENAYKEMEILKQELDTATPQTEAQRLDTILADSKNFEEEVTFDEEGFVDGRDITKEEFYQAQNTQLKSQCKILTTELEKLRATFEAILKAGDNLQADYDQLALERESLQDELEEVKNEKSEISEAKEILLADNNSLHEDLKKLVFQLEKMQERLSEAQSQQSQLQQSVTVASKVGEVARLLEERDNLQLRCQELDDAVNKLEQDHSVLLEEVQSLNESVCKLTSERDQLALDLDEMEAICQQQEVRQQEYVQIESKVEDLQGGIEELERFVSQSSSDPDLLHKIQSLKELLQSERNVNLQANEKVEKNDNEQIIVLKKQIVQLEREISLWEQKHAETVSTYRTHLLSAVQGHMDPDVKNALYHIIELRSMEQFC